MNLKILGHEYEVSIVDSTRYNGDNCGFCDTVAAKIRLSDDLAPDMLASTLLHEVLEAINFHLELKMEHHVLTALEAGMYQVLKDNNLGRFDEFLGIDRASAPGE